HDTARQSKTITPNEHTSGKHPARIISPRAFTKTVKTVTQTEEVYPWKNQQRPKEKLRQVRRKNPCPLCEKTGWCMTNEDRTVVFCHWVTSDHPAKNGEGWFHFLSNDSSNRALQSRQVEVEVTQYVRAEISRRDEVNRKLLSTLKLNDRDRKNLIERG